MKRFTLIFPLTVIVLALALPAAAQTVRAPVVINNAANNSAFSAHLFHPDVHFVVTNVHLATIEASEPNHTCSGASDTHSIWFGTQLQPGTLTLDTTGTTYGNSVISLYRVTDGFFSGFGGLVPLACNDNGTGPGIISSFAITVPGRYYIQISAAQGTTVNVGANATLIANYTAATPHPFDEPEAARTLKWPSLPSVFGVHNATISLDEPEDPALTDPITNTIWFKFTITSERILAVQTFFEGDTLWYSLFQLVAGNYSAVTGPHIQQSEGFIIALIPAGEYYLRVGTLDSPAGSINVFHTLIAAPYITPHNYEFATGLSEGTVTATPSLEDWTLKNASAGPSGDGVFCDGAPVYDCYFQLASSGALEATVLQSKLTLNGLKLKKGDLMVLSTSLLDNIGTPNFTFKLTLTDALGATQSYTLAVKTADISLHQLIVEAPGTFSPVKAKLKVKNKDVVFGNRIEIDSVVSAVLRVGESVLRDGRLPVRLLGGDLPAAWTTSGGETSSVLPAPPPAQ